MRKFSSSFSLLAIGLAVILAAFIWWPKSESVSTTSSVAPSSSLSTSSADTQQRTMTQDSTVSSQASNGEQPAQAGAQAGPAGAEAGKPPQDEASDVRDLTMPEVVKLSTRVVYARCRAVNVQKVNGGNIFTFSDFDVIEVLKGSFPKNSFTLRLLGGRIGDVEIDSATIPKFSPDTEVVLALGKDNAEGYPTIFPQGVFRVQTDSTSKQKFVTPKPKGLALFRLKDRQAYPSSLEILPLDDFLFSLRRLISGR